MTPRHLRVILIKLFMSVYLSVFSRQPAQKITKCTYKTKEMFSVSTKQKSNMNFRPFNGHQNIKKKHRKQTEMFEHLKIKIIIIINK